MSKLPPKKPQKAAPKSPGPAPEPPLERVDADIRYVDEYGIQYADGLVKINLSVDVKISRNYNSCGVQGGITFTTKAEYAPAAVANGFKKLRDALRPEIQNASASLDELV